MRGFLPGIWTRGIASRSRRATENQFRNFQIRTHSRHFSFASRKRHGTFSKRDRNRISRSSVYKSVNFQGNVARGCSRGESKMADLAARIRSGGTTLLGSFKFPAFDAYKRPLFASIFRETALHGCHNSKRLATEALVHVDDRGCYM